MERHLLENVTAPMASSETSSDSSAIVAKLIAGVVTADGTVNNTALIAALTGLQTAAIANDPFTAYKDGRFGIDSGDTAWMLTSCAFVLLSARLSTLPWALKYWLLKAGSNELTTLPPLCPAVTIPGE